MNWGRLPAGLAAVMAVAPAAANSVNATVAIEVIARVVERCGIGATAHTNRPLGMDRVQSFALGFNLDCNTPFRIGVSSRHGALRLVSAADDATMLDGFGIEKPYAVELSFGTDRLGNVVAGSCSSAALRDSQGKCPFFGQAGERSGFSAGAHETAIQRQGQLLISWAAIEGGSRRLVAGDYEDILTVDVVPLL